MTSTSRTEKQRVCKDKEKTKCFMWEDLEKVKTGDEHNTGLRL